MATVDLSASLSDTDQVRVVASWQTDANTDVNGTATPEQVIVYIKKALGVLLSQRVLAYELAIAQAAIAQPVPIAITIT